MRASVPARPTERNLSMYRFLDHPSEAYVEVTDATIEGVFREAAIALFEIMTDTTALKRDREFTIELESEDRSLLLIDWLNRLILLHELEGVFLCDFDVQIQKAENWKIRAIVHGEQIRENHQRRSQAKSATYGQLDWIEMKNENIVRFVVDI